MLKLKLKMSKKIKELEQTCRIKARKHNEIKKIKNYKRKKIYNNYTLSKEQKIEIDNFYKKNYGKKIPYLWHRYYSTYTGKFDVKYVPEIIYTPEIEEKLNQIEYAKALSDKNLLQLLIQNENGLKTPEIIVSCVNGNFRDKNMEFITIEKAKKELYNIGKVFFKVTVDSCSGNGCKILNIKENKDVISGKTIQEVLIEGGKNFNIQNLIVNNEGLQKLNSTSVNTFRITTYIWKNKIYHFPIILRIGRNNAFLDNAHQGGMFIGVEDDGILKDCAFTEFQDRFYEHPDSKVVFKGYKIKEVPKIINQIHLAHEKIPQLGMISWDATINNKNEIVVIEMNLRGQSIWLSQMAHGKGAFGENTEEILQYIRRKNWRKQ